jgi:regulator of sigma E protease
MIRRGTRWKLCAIPLGGYVKFVGDMSATSAPGGDEVEKLSAERAANRFHTQPVWKRAATVFAGPALQLPADHRGLCRVLLGLRQDGVRAVRSRRYARQSGRGGRFLPGDRFVSVDGNPVATFDRRSALRVRPRGRSNCSLSCAEATRKFHAYRHTAIIRTVQTRSGRTEDRRIGVVQTRELGRTRESSNHSPPAALAEAVKQTGHIIQSTGRFLKRLVVGREDRCQLGGPIRIADMAGKAAQQGPQLLIQLIAFLSVGIGILNLLPIPPLDGGHLAFYAIEAVMRRPVSEKTMEAVYRAGFVLVMTFMVFVFWNDIFGC